MIAVYGRGGGGGGPRVLFLSDNVLGHQGGVMGRGYLFLDFGVLKTRFFVAFIRFKFNSIVAPNVWLQYKGRGPFLLLSNVLGH